MSEYHTSLCHLQEGDLIPLKGVHMCQISYTMGPKVVNLEETASIKVDSKGSCTFMEILDVVQ